MPALFPAGVPISKRLFDLVLTIPALVILSPVLLVLGMIIWLFHGWPILYRQPRGGHGGQIFSIYKFRTMRNLVDASGSPLPDDQRLTRLGKFLRAVSLDELPELINVLRGEMSIVGPRPLMAKYLPLYSAEQARRHAVLPGITGWAQINGRNALTWEEKFAYDVWYVDHRSLWLDLKIIVLTIRKALAREGINQPGQATAEEFRGSGR